MPDTLSAADACRDAALKRVNWYRFRAVHMRSLAKLSAWPAVWFCEAARADARADAIWSAMKDPARC